MTAARVQLRIVGRVQGVLYRASTQTEAARLGLTGWVRNEPDGSVSVVAEGARDGLEALVQWCRRGPSQAQVEDIEVAWSDATGDSGRFEITR